jgi:SAM-dependent methyltransferase
MPGPETTQASSHYDVDYFNWQKSLGAFGGWANAYKFRNSIKPTDIVIDFGCGGGFLLNNLECQEKIGIEPNVSASNSIRSMNIKHFVSPIDALSGLGIGFADVIISTNVLEHTLNPLQEIKHLRRLLKTGGIIHFVVPCDSIAFKYKPGDINHHLFSWSPMNLGNLFSEAGFRVEYAKPYVHKWPPFYKQISALGWPIFNVACRIYGHLERSWFQVEVMAIKTDE